MERPSSPLSHLRQALSELRFNYHQALARKLGRRSPPAGQLRRLIANERDEDRVISLMAAQRRSLLRWTGLSWVRMLFSRFSRQA
jgi:hypothetical protein